MERGESDILPDKSEPPANPEARIPVNGRSFPKLERGVLDGVRRGDPDALASFFDTYFDRIYGLAFRLLSDRSLAEDATQDICYRLQKAAGRLDPDRDPGPWVLTTTLNVCRSLWRSSGHRMSRTFVPADDAVCEIAESTIGPEERLLAREREAMVARAVDALHAPLREVVILHDYLGLDHKEIAVRINASHEAVRKRYSRALGELAERLRGKLA